MSAIVLCPGFGMGYISDTLGGAIGSDTIDARMNESFSVQVNQVTALGGTFQIQQTTNDSDWVDLGSAVAATDGATALFDKTDGPFRKLRIDALLMTGTGTFYIEGNRIAY